MVTTAQATQAAQLAESISQLQLAIAQLQAVIAANMTVSKVIVMFNETVVPVHIDNKLTQADTNTLLSGGLAILQGYLTADETALAAIS
jgi:DNA-binding protein YbaB